MKRIAVVVKTVTEFNRAASLLLAMGYNWVSDDKKIGTPHRYNTESDWGIGAKRWEVIYNEDGDDDILRGEVDPSDPGDKLFYIEKCGHEIWMSADEFLASHLIKETSPLLQLNLKSLP